MASNLNTVKIESRPYHHGDLTTALIAAGLEVLKERGVGGFSLRETAKRAGVSPAAPAHHFKDARGLLTALATLAFEGLSSALEQALAASQPEAASDRKQSLIRLCQAYVAYAQKEPQLFDLMWKSSLLNCQDMRLLTASSKAYRHLHHTATGETLPEIMTSGQGPQCPDPRVIGIWSLAHGYATLKLQTAFFEPDPDFLERTLDQILNRPS